MLELCTNAWYWCTPKHLLGQSRKKVLAQAKGYAYVSVCVCVCVCVFMEIVIIESLYNYDVQFWLPKQTHYNLIVLKLKLMMLCLKLL